MRPRKLTAPVTLFAKVPSEEYQAVRKIAFAERRSIADVTRQALVEFVARHRGARSAPLSPAEKKRFHAEANAAFERLRNDPEAWQHELAERKAWDGTLMDGLEADDIPEKRTTPRRTRRTGRE